MKIDVERLAQVRRRVACDELARRSGCRDPHFEDSSQEDQAAQIIGMVAALKELARQGREDYSGEGGGWCFYPEWAHKMESLDPEAEVRAMRERRAKGSKLDELRRAVREAKRQAENMAEELAEAEREAGR